MYYFLYGLLYLFSLLPFWILYGIADFVYFIIYHVWGYRKEIVMNNLTIAFPEKSEAEKTAISKQFYRNLVDNFIETIKLLSISKKQLSKRFIGDYSSLKNYYEAGHNVQVHLGHFFNWEFGNLSVSLACNFPVLVVYMPIVNRAMNRLFLKLRGRFGAKLIAATRFRKEFMPYMKSRYAIIFVADQNAGMPDSAYWAKFFGKLVPFVTGPEKTARLTNAVVVFANFRKHKRGVYEASFQPITETPRKLDEGEIR